MKAAELENVLPKKSKRQLRDLAEIIKNRPDDNQNYCLFLGAGASRTSGIRTAGELVEHWRQRCYLLENLEAPNASPDSMIQWLSQNQSDWYAPDREYASLIEKLYPLPSHRRKFIEQEVAEKQPSIGYAYLVRLAEAGFFRTIFTTNFDDLINEAFYQFSGERPLVCAHDSSVASISITSRRSKIIKLHGDYLFDDLKASEAETRALEKNMQEKLIEFLKEYGLIIVGYSGTDRSITDNLQKLLQESHALQNGLIWCFRVGDTISRETVEILKRPNAFYVIIDGFDEVIAELHTHLIGENTPFSSKIASDRASALIESYLGNPQLKSSSSPTIQRHLAELNSDRRTTLITDALHVLSAESIASSRLSDASLLVLLEIEKDIKDRKLESVLQKIDQELATGPDRKLQEVLLHRRFVCSQRLYRVKDAEEAANRMLEFEPMNYFVSLSKCSLLESRQARLAFLSDLKTQNPYSSVVLNRYAYELRKAYEHFECPANVSYLDIASAYQQSLVIDPRISNSAWSGMFGVLANKVNSVEERVDKLRQIVDEHLKQNAYSVDAASILLKYCKFTKNWEYNNKQLLTHLLEGYQRHFPKNHGDYIDVIIEACVELDQFELLKSVLSEARKRVELETDESFTMTLMNVHYDIFRDVRTAIEIGERFVKVIASSGIWRMLFDFYLDIQDIEMARDCFNKVKGSVDKATELELKSHIYEREERFQDAIDVIESIPDRREFEEKYCAQLSFLELSMGRYKEARTRLRGFLEKRNFSFNFQTELINYEFARIKDNAKLKESRLRNMLGVCDTPAVRGVCLLLLGDKAEALDTLKKEAKNRFSCLDMFLRWPVLEGIRSDLVTLKQELSSAKRTLEDL